VSIRRVLIANRGEIAVRIIRSCRALGIETVLAASEADLHAVPARLADHTICIGPPPAAKSYLNIPAIISAAQTTGADAIHPGYGFVAENRKFAHACDTAGIIFIGPTEAQLDAVGDKLKARHNALEAGLTVVPGAAIETPEQGLARAEEFGFPVLIKAVGGGGGRGLKQVRDPAQLKATMTLSMAEAEAAFGDGRIYLERYVEAGRHVEVQVLGDGSKVIHLGTRDCSIQRRYQKLVEEAPAPALPEPIRSAMHDAAVAFGRHLHYRGLGTVEFLYDVARREFYFLEMNARIQVEHPVTEAITGLDLVAEQIAVAEGRSLRLQQQDVALNGHAIECRINAEDVNNDFHPSPGRIDSARFPVGDGIRVDTHIEPGVQVPPFYDSLIAKIITSGADRAAAIARMQTALADCTIEGVATNLSMHRAIMRDAAFTTGGVTTAFFANVLNQ
jgi:acetyl-CoA carboxylase biotin carboxylase subunit